MSESSIEAIEDQITLLNREWPGWAIWVLYSGTWIVTGEVIWMARNRDLMPDPAQFLAAGTAGQLNIAIGTTAAAAAVPAVPYAAPRVTGGGGAGISD